MDGSDRTRWHQGGRRSVQGAPKAAEPDPGAHRTCAPGAPGTIRLGGDEAASATPARPSRLEAPVAVHCEPDPRPPRQAAEEPATPALEASGCRAARDGRPQRDLACGFQGSVQDAGWPVLLPADGHRSLQPHAAALQRSLLGSHGRCQAGFQTVVSRARSSGRHSDGQWRAVRFNGHPRSLRAQRLVDEARHRASVARWCRRRSRSCRKPSRGCARFP